MRLIDLDSLIVEFKKRCRGECCCCTEDYCGSENDGCGCRVIDNAPTVDAVKRGHWDNKIIDARFDVPHTVARCSNCKGKIWVYAENYEVKYPYCPLCGARMDEVEEDG